MKKFLSIALALVLVLSMGMVALADDAAAGTEQNPISVNSPMEVNNQMVTVPANSTLWYNFSSMTFNGMNLQATQGLAKITVDGTEYYPSMQLRGGIEAPLVARAPSMVVGLVNESADDVMVFLSVAAPKGSSMDAAEELYEGETMFNLDGSVVPYYYAFTSSNIAGKLKVTTEADSADYEVAIFTEYGSTMPTVAAQPEGEKNETSLEIEMDTYTTVWVAVAPFGPVAGLITVEYEVPEEGSEANPIQIWSSDELGNLTVPANSTLYVTLSGFLGSCSAVYVEGSITATVDGEAVTMIEGGENAPYSMTLALTNDSDKDYVEPMWAVYPIGTAQNPDYIENGEYELNETVDSYYYTYEAMKDGTVTVKVDSIDSIYGLSIENVTVTDDPDYDWSDAEKYTDYLFNHADKDENGDIVYDEETYQPVYSSPSQYYVTLEVSQWDVLVIAVEGGKYDDEGNVLPIDITLTVEGPEAPVGYEQNPDEFENGKNEFTISAGYGAYYGVWTAPADGTVSITFAEQPEDAVMVLMSDLEEGNYENFLYLAEGDELTLEVKKGDEVFIGVLGDSDEDGNYVETAVVMTIDGPEVPEEKPVEKPEAPDTGAAGAGVAVVLALASAAGLALLNKKRA